MKILLVSLNHAPEQTGIGKFQGEMAAWLAARGHKVRAIAAPPYYPSWKVSKGYSATRYKVENIDGVRVYRVPIYVPANQSGVKRLIHMASYALTSFPLILWQAIAWRPDVIWVTAPPLMATPAVLLAGLMPGTRAHLHVHDFEVDTAFNLGLLKKGRMFGVALAIERFLLRAFSTVSSVSPRMRDRLILKGVRDDRAFLIPNWAGVNDFDSAQGAGAWLEHLKPNPETVLAVYSGNLGKKQGLETIAEAARKLKDEPNIRIVISGDGAGRTKLLADIEGLTNVTILPVQPLPEFIQLMLASDIHLLPQKAEAADLVMPSKLGNMLASGRPIVAGAKPGTQLFDAIQGCGIAVAPDSVDEFVDAIIALARDKNLRGQMGAQGRRRAQDEWSRESILPKLENMFKKATA